MITWLEEGKPDEAIWYHRQGPKQAGRWAKGTGVQMVTAFVHAVGLFAFPTSRFPFEGESKIYNLRCLAMLAS